MMREFAEISSSSSALTRPLTRSPPSKILNSNGRQKEQIGHAGCKEKS